MRLVLLALLATAAQRLLVIEETVTVPASQVRAVNLNVAAREALLECEFEVRGPGSGIRVALMRWEQAERFRLGKSHQTVSALPYSRDGKLRAVVSAGGRYQMILDNRMEGRGPSDVRMKVWLTFGPIVPVELSTGRRAAVVVTSLGFFFAVVWFGGRKLWAATRARRIPWPPGPSA